MHIFHQFLATAYIDLEGVLGQPTECSTQVAISKAGFEERLMTVTQRKLLRQIQDDR
ncbi:hypothetical protein D3C72_2369980 [compost metagenome]